MTLPAKIGRPAKRPPADATARIRALSAVGWGWTGIAAQLLCDRKTLGKWREDDASLQEAYDEGRAEQEHAVHNKLYDLAMAGNVTALIFLGKARFGWREGDQGDTAGRVNVTIALPGAMTIQQFTAIGKETTNG